MIARSMIVAAMAWLALATPTHAVLPQEMLPDAAQEARARALSQELRCQVCQNQSIDDSNAPLAADLRRLVRERIVAGDSDEAILAYLVARYGDNVLLRPPVRPATWPLWFGSACALLIAGAGVALWLRRNIATSARAAPPLAPEEESRLATLLDDDGHKG